MDELLTVSRADATSMPLLPWSPLTQHDALQEAQLLELRLDAVRSRLALLFDLRTALQFPDWTTGLLVAEHTADLEWHSEQQTTRHTAWNVVGSAPQDAAGHFALELWCWPNAKLTVRGANPTFFAFDIPELDGLMPDYVADVDAEIKRLLPRWDSRVARVHAAFGGFVR